MERLGKTEDGKQAKVERFSLSGLMKALLKRNQVNDLERPARILIGGYETGSAVFDHSPMTARAISRAKSTADFEGSVLRFIDTLPTTDEPEV